MSQNWVNAAERAAIGPRSRPRARGPLITKSDLLPLMALFGAVYGWVLVVVAAAVALVVVLVS